MTYGAEIWGPPLIAAAGSALSGLGNASKETKMQKTQRKLVDRLISSLEGVGPYADLFNADEDVFQKSFVQPAQSMFRNQIAPQIQQQFIASGQQRGTGLDDTLTRAGVDLDTLLNSQFYNFQQDALNRKQTSINSILGAGTGAQRDTTPGQDAISGLGGYLASSDFSSQFKDYLKPQTNTTANLPEPPRKGFDA